MKSLVITVMLLYAACSSAMTQEIRDFSLSIDKRRQEAANLHCGCTYLQNDPLADVVLNNNNTVVYRKGPLALVRIAEQIEYGELMHVISGFYREYAGKYPLKYTDFINLLNESHSGVGGGASTAC